MNHEHLELLVTREMPFGKYKGRLIADLPGNYLNWFAQGFSARRTRPVAGADAGTGSQRFVVVARSVAQALKLRLKATRVHITTPAPVKPN